MSVPLSSLPPELLEWILSLLQWKDIVVCQGVCRLFRDVVQNSPRLTYKIDLALAGFVDHCLAPRCDTEARRKILANAQRVWREVSRFDLLESLKVLDLSFWPLREGVIMRASPDDDSLKTFDVNVLSTKPGPPTHFWKVKLPTMENGVLCVDAQQDLLLVRGGLDTAMDPSWYSCALLSFRTGEPHPRASKSTLRFKLSERVLTMPHYTRFQIVDDIACVSLAGGAQGFTEAVFLNWVSGEEVARFCPSASGTERRAWGVPATLISPTCFLMTSFSLDEQIPCIEVHTIVRHRQSEANENCKTVHVASFNLPRLRQREVRVLLTPTSRQVVWADNPEDGYLETSLESCMLHVAFMRAEAGGPFEDPVFFTPFAPFLRECDLYRSLDPEDQKQHSPKIIPWTHWGRHTRWIEVITTEPTWMHGMRRNLKGVGSRYAFPRCIVDFAPLELARVVHERKRANPDITEFDLDGWTVRCGIPEFANITGSALFAEDIISALPYREKILPDFPGFMPDHDIYFVGDKIITVEGGIDDEVRIYAPNSRVQV